MVKKCLVCGREFTRRATERPASFRARKRCGFYCRPVTNPDRTGRARAEAMYPTALPCEVCGRTPTDRHHRNSDRLDNSPENIGFLCRAHHNAAHRLTDGKVGGGGRPRIAALTHERGVERAQHAWALRAEGKTRREIAAALGIHEYSVPRYFREARYRE